MSNAYDEFLDGVEPPKEQSEGGVLRKKLEDAIKLLREKDAKITELTKQFSGKLVDDFLTTNKIPAKFHKLAKKELGDTPNEDAFKNFVTEYGELWDAESDADVDTPANQELQSGLEKIEQAAREAKGLGNQPFKMPSPYELSRMNEDQIAKLMAQIPQTGPYAPK